MRLVRNLLLAAAGLVALVYVDAPLGVTIGKAQERVGITRSPDGSFSITQILNHPTGEPLTLPFTINEGSTLQRESIVLNVPDVPLRLVSASMHFGYEESQYFYNMAAQVDVAVPITALEVRHMLFDVFGEHMQNLSNTEATDITPGDYSMAARWNTLRENPVYGAITEHLTTVSYVAKARLRDGRVWKFDFDALSDALESLNLEWNDFAALSAALGSGRR